MTEIESVMGSIASNLKPEMVTKNIVQRMQPIQCLGIAIMPRKDPVLLDGHGCP